MTDDIVERLRAYAKDQGRRHNIEDTCEEAADEIERLQWLASEQAKDIVMLGQLAGQSAAHEARIAAQEQKP